ncbi:MAG: hypothetical protein C0428_05315 [Polaromonas sp.]|nr:hypothetical protein [Polaromonas sp.]
MAVADRHLVPGPLFKLMKLKFNVANGLLLLAGLGCLGTGIFSVVTEAVGSGFGRGAPTVTLYKEDGASAYWFMVLGWFGFGIWLIGVALMSAREEYDAAPGSLADQARRRARQREVDRLDSR